MREIKNWIKENQGYTVLIILGVGLVLTGQLQEMLVGLGDAIYGLVITILLIGGIVLIIWGIVRIIRWIKRM